MQDSSMKLRNKKVDNKSISVFVRITPDMNAWLAELAEQTGGGVATVMREICENARAEGVTVTNGRPRRSKRPKNETVEAATE